jgi:hypothetical protein
MMSDRHRAIGEGWGKFGEVRHDLTLRLLSAATKLAKPGAAEEDVHDTTTQISVVAGHFRLDTHSGRQS